MGYYRFLDRTFSSFTLPYKLKKKMLTKNPLNYYTLKVTKFGVKNEC